MLLIGAAPLSLHAAPAGPAQPKQSASKPPPGGPAAASPKHPSGKAPAGPAQPKQSASKLTTQKPAAPSHERAGGGIHGVILIVDASSPDVPAKMRAEAQRALTAALQAHGLKARHVRDDPAAATTRQIDELLAQAKKLAREFREGDALARLREADALFRRSASQLRTTEPLVTVLLTWAKIAEDAGQHETADTALRRLATLGPDRALDPGRFPPPMVNRFLRIREAAARSTGQIRVLSSPAQLPVWIDGARRGATPLALGLPTGEHLVTVGPAGRSISRLVTVSAAAPTDVRLRVTEPDDNALRALGAKADADRVASYLLTLKAGRYRLGLRVVQARTIAQATALRSDPFPAERLAAVIKELTGKALPALGVASAAPAPPPADEPSKSLFRRWWFWTAVGAVVAAGGVTAAVLLTRDYGVQLRLVP